MKEYSVRYLSMKTLTSVCENGKTVKYTYEEAVEKAKELNARADVSYCKIYKGRTLIETVEKPVEETVETEMKKYYFISEIRGIVGEHSGNIRGAKTKAQKFAEQFDEEITILVRSNKEIDCGKNIPANEVCRVCNADGDVLAVCSTYGNAFAWCAENGIEGEIGEYEPYIEVGTYSENGNFEVEDYSSIDTGDGMWNIINDYCDYVDTVCPEATTETEQTEVEETAETETEETIKTTAERQKDEVITMTRTSRDFNRDYKEYGFQLEYNGWENSSRTWSLTTAGKDGHIYNELVFSIEQAYEQAERQIKWNNE